MDINTKKLEIIQQIMLIQEPEIIGKIDGFIHNLDYDDRNYTRKRFYEDGTPIEKKEEKPKLINQARRKIKGILNLDK